MTRPLPILVLTLLLAAVLLPATASAQTYRWTDDGGRVHYSQGLDSIPERFRAGARVLGVPEPPPAAAAPSDPAAPRPAAAAQPAKAGPPAGVTPPGGTRISFTPGSPIMVTARINDGGTADLMLDTGAQITVINPRVLAALGVGMRDARRSTLRGVTGSADTLTVTLDSVEVSGARVGPLSVVSHDAGAGTGDGLLGRDFLDRFTVTIDNAAGVVTLTPR